ncbi:OmpA-OmpF porin, OOP family [Palleronia salina]|mgnify:CR=1 FL=1|uniref:OmpA-OmpF porin, OOP family n=1 Tax=Palleronia salina TaxID=313368 RepID=A0A1M6CED7_9RHOB|nr:OmpA family protein [Palleronia salina]SHI59346.1 OmpA-OmpF porin, OOP family [Palleronia salina]
MGKRSFLPLILTFGVAGGAAVFAATVAVEQIEQQSVLGTQRALSQAGLDWTTVEADGLRLKLAGTAPDEAARFRALSVAGNIVDAARVDDLMAVEKRDTVEAPTFSIEILRQPDEITLIGLVPQDMDRQALIERVARAAFETRITDLLEVASFPAPPTWSDAVDYGIESLEGLTSAKVSIGEASVSLTTLADSAAARDRLERDLDRAAPEGLDVTLDIQAPRPVVAPFILRLVKDGEGMRFNACTAATEQGAARILSAAQEAGVPAGDDCRLALGLPSPDWARVGARAIRTLGALDGGQLTISDLQVRLEAAQGQEPAVFETAVSDLRADLPDAFTLTATLPDDSAVEPEAGPAQFVVTRSPEGLVQMRGRVGSERAREATLAYARSLFGVEQIDSDLEVLPQVPQGWSPRLLVALDSLSMLTNGAVMVDESQVDISGTTGTRDADDEIARILAGRMGESGSFSIDVSYDERADPTAALPSPEECVEQINAILTERQITFDPGSAIIDAESRASVDAIAEVVKQCEGVPMEVGGFTDSQGREEMNQQLSQQRAEALLAGLMARRVLTSDLVARGYGEENPIADNSTAEGREANRRLEFRLLDGEESASDSAEDEAPPE